jgi:hypothetical protein
MEKLPSKLKQYFWDTPLENISMEKHHRFIIERLLEKGDFDELIWVNKNFTKKQIIETLQTSTKISEKTGNFFSMYYNIPKKDMLCMNKPYTLKQNELWR